MLVRIKYAALVAAFAAAGAAAYSGQAGPQSKPISPPVPGINLNLVVLDPAHGGPETGATLGDHVFEKDVTLAIAVKVRGALASRGFAIVSTREGDPQQALTTDQRAEVANRSRAVACLVLHATSTGHGVHLFASKLQPAPQPEPDDQSAAHFVPISWDSAQAGSVDQSLHMADDLRAALSSGSVPVTFGRASVPPLDNMVCPAVAVEVAPPEPGTDATPIRDAAYQQKIVDAIANGLTAWRTQMTPPPETPTQSGPADSAPKAKVVP